MRVGAIDIGTNSVLLLIAELRAEGLVALVERATITRLGQGVDATRKLAPAAIERTLACLAQYGEDLRASGVERLDAVGTSAMRDAAGGEEFVSRARDLIGVAPRVITGEEEAELTFKGALTGLPLRAAQPAIVFDVGGGSTEIILGAPGGLVEGAVSLDVGSVRLTERYLRTDPPTAAALASMRADVQAALKTAPVPRECSTPPSLVGVAGTVTTLAALAGDVFPYDGRRIHGASLTLKELTDMTFRLASLPIASRRQLRPLDPARADVIVAGGVLVEEIVAWAGASTGAPSELIVSDRGVRWGLADRLAFS